MSTESKNFAFIPVRGGSKSIPLKNIKMFCGKPLVYWAAKAANDCPQITEVYVSTDSEKISETVDDFHLKKVKIVGRSAKTAEDIASTESAMLEFANQYDFDNIILIQATSPLIATDDLNAGMSKYFQGSYDSLLSVVRQKRFIWQEYEGIAKALNYNPKNRPRRQEWEGYLVENGAFYITSRKRLLDSRCRISGKTGTYAMADSTYFEIDEPNDWLIMEQLKKNSYQ